MGTEDSAVPNQLGAWFDPSGKSSPGDLLKGLEVSRPADGVYRIQVTGAGNGQARFHLSTVSGRHKTVLKEVDHTLTEGRFFKYELDYSRTGGSSVSEVSNFTPEARPEVASDPQAGKKLTFDGSTSFDADGNIGSYEWDFGDGGTASGSEASHAYAKRGTYTVTLEVTDDNGATDTSTAEVNGAPSDTVASTTATLSPQPNADGWNKDKGTLTSSARFKSH